MPLSTSDTGWVRILARATAWQGRGHDADLCGIPRQIRLNSATVGETTKRLLPIFAATSASVIVTLRGAAPPFPRKDGRVNDPLPEGERHKRGDRAAMLRPPADAPHPPRVR